MNTFHVIDYLKFLLFLNSLLFNSVCTQEIQNSSFELSIIHFSDFHARYVPVSPMGGLCYNKEKCVGGIARVASIAKRLKQSRPNAIFLNSGDCFQGTLYYDLFRGNITATFMNELPHDAITVGNHDFDDEISGFESYVRQLKAPVVVTNIDQSNEHMGKNLYENSTIIRRGDKNIGVIGVIFNETDKISKTTGKLKFLNEVDTINLEAQKLKTKGVNIIIVLSHCGIDHDKIIAESCPDVDVIVGGHSHILLYNGDPPNHEVVYDKYPIVITQKNNRKVLIVHPSAFTKFMGDLKVIFDEHDEVAQWSGNPIYLDRSIEEDQLILKKLQPWKVQVDNVGKEVIGQNKVYLNGTCDSSECNLGDFVADALVDKYRNETLIAMTSAINFQNSIPPGPILYEDLYMSLPYNNTWDLIELQGKDLLQVLEDNVAGDFHNKNFSNIKFFQFSGLKVVYNLRSSDNKVISVKLKRNKKKYTSLNKDKWYKIAVQSYLVSPAFPLIYNKNRNHTVGKTFDVQNLVDYVKKIKVVNSNLRSRIIFQ